jgi:AraC-like DNA-binding protein
VLGTVVMDISGVHVFADADDYAHAVGIVPARFVVTGPGRFWAHMARLALPHLDLLVLTESQPRTAFIALAPERLHVTYSLRVDTSMFCSGVGLQRDDIWFHSRDDRFHQRVSGPAHWGLLSLDPIHFAAAVHALTGRSLNAQKTAGLFRPPHALVKRLFRLHGAAVRFGEQKSKLVLNPEVARAIEHDLIECLISCLLPDNELGEPGFWRHRTEVLGCLEAFLEANPARAAPTEELAAVLGVSQRTLHSYCADCLGVSPGRYLRLRRLKLVRQALLSAPPNPPLVAAVAKRHGFLGAGRFAATYQAAFGELPSATLDRARARKTGAAF